MNSFLYRTIDAPTESLVKERGSKFYGYAHPCANENEAKAILETYRTKYPDATHHCYAWKLGVKGENERWSDDGEPGNSAGRPIFRQILSFEVTNVFVVVVRYYGGKKLGVPGLIHAYGQAANDCLTNAKVITQELQRTVLVKMATGKAYEIYSLQRFVDVGSITAVVDDDHLFEVKIKESDHEKFVSIIKDLQYFEYQVE